MHIILKKKYGFNKLLQRYNYKTINHFYGVIIVILLSQSGICLEDFKG